MSVSRRAVLAGAASTAALLSVEAGAQARPVVNLQLSWLLNEQQLGEICAKQLGYYQEEGLDLRFQGGGPNIDGVAIVASGRHEIGQVSSSPSLMLAASQDIPVRCFAAGAQEHPFAYVSRAAKPVRTPQDLVGKKVGTQSTAVILLRALLAKHNIPERQVQVVPIGSDLAPLMTGQVDVITTWVTNVNAMRIIPDPVVMRLWDEGVRLYAKPFYATAQTLERRADVVARFLRATARGWVFARDNLDQAMDLLVKEVPNLNKASEKPSAEAFLGYVFNAKTAANGYGAMEAAVWQEQLDLYAQLGQFTRRTPRLDEVMTLELLRMTADARPKVG
jgi:NitT/TauT family transport system substrate-binding protein